MLTKNYSIELAEYNVRECKPSKVIGTMGEKQDLPSDVGFSSK
jgi:hypothetical protein